ncbi:MAG: hypothetical protein BIFFINMI_02012 [Phycisphaerae bacterium]|nr:hypothetical protein [Phycisphaerae bacterium]
MAYAHNWTHQDANGHVLAGDRIYAVDSTEIRDAADRRLKVMFNPAGKWPIPSTAAVGAAIDDQNMAKVRDGFLAAVPLWGYFAGESSWWQLYTLRAWLYPVTGPDEDKWITSGSQTDMVNFFAAINGGAGWTGSVGVGQPVRAVHINEPRDAAALLSRGRFVLRVGDGGEARASSGDLPGGLWYPPAVLRDGAREMHSWFGGQVWMWKPDGASGWFGTRGQSATVRSTSKIRLKPLGSNVKLQLYHSAAPLAEGEFTWAEGQAATGQHIADFDLTDNTWTEWSSPAFLSLLQQMADGAAEPSFKIAPNEQTGWPDEPTHVDVEVWVDFDLNSPPL